MASIGPSALRQASRLASNSPTLSASLRRATRTSRTATAVPQALRRSYVTESKRDNAQVAEPKIETAIHLDRAVLDKAGLTMGGKQEGNMLVSPMAGKSSQIRIHRSEMVFTY